MRFAILLTLALCATASADTVRGTVFHDANGNNQLDDKEFGIPNVLVSNGHNVTKTDAEGRYALPATDDMIVFITKPRDWMTPLCNHQLPQFFYVHKPAGSPQLKYPGVDPTGPLPSEVNFPLVPRKEQNKFRILVFGDPQPYTLQEVDYFAHDIIAPLVGTDVAFGMSLGDLVGDDLTLFDPLNRAVAHLNIPWYNILGNHDIDFAAKDDQTSDETFEAVYGPPYYSFDYGNVHFVVLDDVMWVGKTAERNGFYYLGFGERQLDWLENNLKHVPKSKLLVLTMHIPINTGAHRAQRELMDAERKRLYNLIAEFPHCISFSAHHHINQHHFITRDDGWPKDEPHHHLNFVTTSGSWWRGAPDELGIPHTMMRCGAPNGWSFVTFDNTDYNVEFRAARRPADYQMDLHLPDAVSQEDLNNTELVANIFAGSERSRVAFRVGDGPWREMRQEAREAPFYTAIKQLEQSENPPHGRKLPAVIPSPHLWVADMPSDLAPGTHRVHVRTTDMFGATHNGYRLIRVTPSPGAVHAETDAHQGH